MHPNIYIGFPTGPFQYNCGHRSSWSQIYKFIFEALLKEFGMPIYHIPWDANGLMNFEKDDVFITTLSTEPILESILRCNKVILVDNGNFNVDKWKTGYYNKYGYRYQTNPKPTAIFGDYIKHALCEFVKTNDVAIKKWNEDHVDVYECKKWYVDNNINIKLMQHPIDKEFYSSFYDADKNYNEMKMLIYHTGMYKNGAHLAALLKKIGYIQGKHFDVQGWVDMTKPNLTVKKYSIFAHTSFCEGFPYLLNELFTAGEIPFANEDWWLGYGEEKTRWSYDPNRQEQNAENLKFLFDKNNIDTVNKMRHDLHKKHMEREDNNWDYFLKQFIEEVKKAL